MDGDTLHLLRERIAREVHKVVDRMTKHLSPEDDDLLRQQLTEQFRFWRQT